MRLSPAETAYEFIQRAAIRSPLVLGNVLITHELFKGGICIRARAPGVSTTREIGWSTLAFSREDPLSEALQWVIKDLATTPGVHMTEADIDAAG